MKRTAFALALAATVASCADLPPIAANACGNGVVDPGEDCDPGSRTQTACLAPGEANACHFACDHAASPTGCPEGFGCGTDGTCRAATGAFDAKDLVAGDARRLGIADFDGDGAGEVLVSSSSRNRTLFFDGSTNLTATYTLPGTQADPSWGRLTGDTRQSVVLTSELVDVWRGTTAKSFEPTVYPAFPNASADSFVLAAQANAATLVDEVLIYQVQDAGAYRLDRINPVTGNPSPMLGNLPLRKDLASDRPLTGYLSHWSPCEAIVLATKNAKTLQVRFFCNLDGTPADADALPAANLSVADDIQRVILEDLEGDGVSEIIVQGKAANGKLRYWLLAPDDQLLAPYAFLPPVQLYAGVEELERAGTTLLAAGNLNDDGTPDLVLDAPSPDSMDRRALVVLSGRFGPVPTVLRFAETWRKAFVSDLNLNGFGDVVAMTDTSIEFLNGTGGPVFPRLSYGIDGYAREAIIGDFDSDLVPDVAVLSSYSESEPADAVDVLWGRVVGYPEAPVLAGTVSGLETMSYGYFSRDVVSSLAETTTPTILPTLLLGGCAKRDETTKVCSGGYVSGLLGDPSRRLSAPFRLATTNAQGAAVAATAGTYQGQPAIFALGLSAGAGPQAALEPALWVAKLQGEAELAGPLLRTPLPAGIQGDVKGLRRPKMRAIRLQKDASSGAIVLVSAQAQGLMAYVIQEGGQAPQSLQLGPASEITRETLVEVGDVDGDGLEDVLVVAFPDRTTSRAQILWNRGDGTLSAEPIKAPEPILAMAPLRVDGGAPKLLLLTQTQAFATDARPGAVAPPVPFRGLPGGSLVAVGDIDGDGVQDVAIRTTFLANGRPQDGGVQVFHQRSHLEAR